jgi:hypothetical protein
MGDILHGIFRRRHDRPSAHPAVVGAESAPELSAAVTGANTPAPEAPTFDPGAHTVAAVLDYVAEHPEQRDAVLAAEAAGKARKSLLSL